MQIQRAILILDLENQIYNVTNLNLTDNNSLFPVTGRLNQ